MKRGSTLWLVLAVLLFGGYPASYAALRLTHGLVHTSFWTSMEGLDGHHLHAMEGPRPLWLLYQPLIAVELELQRRHQP